MRYTKEQLLSRLQLQVEFTKYEHPVILTVEAQVCQVEVLRIHSHIGREKILRFLRIRYPPGQVCWRRGERIKKILIYEGQETVVLYRVSSCKHQRRFERQVSQLLDQGFRSQEICIFHPLSNDTSIGWLTPKWAKINLLIWLLLFHLILLTCLRSLRRDLPRKTLLSKRSLLISNPMQSKPKLSNPWAKAVGLRPCISFSDPGLFAEEILDKTSALLLSEITEESINHHGGNLGVFVSDNFRKRLSSELKNFTVIFHRSLF